MKLFSNHPKHLGNLTFSREFRIIISDEIFLTQLQWESDMTTVNISYVNETNATISIDMDEVKLKFKISDSQSTRNLMSHLFSLRNANITDSIRVKIRDKFYIFDSPIWHELSDCLTAFCWANDLRQLQAELS